MSKIIKVTDEIKDGQLPKLPKEIKFCSRCVVSNQRPRIGFDENNVCSACHWAYEKQSLVNWDAREHELVKLLDQYRSKDGSYDVVVPGSGGKDSSIVAHKLKHKYGMHPLTITWAPFMYTDIGWKNYVDFKDSGFDNILCYPDGKLHRKLSLLAFDLLGDAWEPFAYGQQSWAFQIATRFNIPLVFFGENGELEYGGTTRNKNKAGEPLEEWAEIYYKDSGISYLVEQGLKRNVFTKEEVHSKLFELYEVPDLDAMKRVGTQMHWWSYYNKWVPQEHYYYAVEHTGFTANPVRSEGTYSKYASLDDKTDGFHFYLAFIKFGIGRCTSDAAHEIRDGHLTRDEGVALVHKYDGEFPIKYYKEFLDYLGINDQEFWQVCDKFRQPHIWDKVDGKWALKHRVDYIPPLAQR
ncbi:MAG: N-acetyl sugar amidotransferase [Deltaproteobacteria bacterium]|nr:N-acetyl sugar amidotransferase [Deltaproteobacteria bacterium]